MTFLESKRLSIKKLFESENQFLLSLRKFINRFVKKLINCLLNFIKWVSLFFDRMNHIIYSHTEAFFMQSIALTHFIITHDCILITTPYINTQKMSKFILSTLSIVYIWIPNRFIVFLNKINMIIFRVFFFHFKD